MPCRARGTEGEGGTLYRRAKVSRALPARCSGGGEREGEGRGAGEGAGGVVFIQQKRVASSPKPTQSACDQIVSTTSHSIHQTTSSSVTHDPSVLDRILRRTARPHDTSKPILSRPSFSMCL